MNKVYLTGGTGFLGNNIFRRLKADTYLFSRGESLDGMIDFDPDTIIHCAGEVYEELDMVESNITLTYRLLMAAKQLKNLKSFIYIGSSSEYGRKDHPMKEDELLEPTNVYEATKGAGTLLCQAFAREFNLPVMVARPFSLYGKNEPDFRFIPKAIKASIAGWAFPLAPGVHDWIHVDDFIDGIFLLAENPQPGEIFNFGTGKQTSNEKVLDLIEEIIGRKTKREIVGQMRIQDSSSWVADITKAKKLGWRPRYTLRRGLTEVAY